MSNTRKKSVLFSIYEFSKCYKNGKRLSNEHRRGMVSRLKTSMTDLFSLGYKPTHIARIKQKHIDTLVQHWQKKGLSTGTIKNRLSDWRFVCRHFKRTDVIKDNSAYGIGQRSYIPEKNKAHHQINLDPINSPYVYHSAQLQRVFGLRREESIKIIPSQADEGKYLRLQGSWTKGGIERIVPIRTEEQREWLNKAKTLAGQGHSLIPEGKSYIQQRHTYDRYTREAGATRLHGLRHAYAQNRYSELTGWRAPIDGGPARLKLSLTERRIDRKARLIISNELGHSRVAIAKNYLG